MRLSKRLLSFVLAVAVSILPTITVLANGAGSTNVNTGSASPGDGTGGATLVSLVKIPNLAKSTYNSDLSGASPGQGFKNLFYTDSGEYIGDYRVSMLIASNRGMDEEYWGEGFVNNCGVVTRDGYASREHNKVEILWNDGSAITKITNTEFFQDGAILVAGADRVPIILNNINGQDVMGPVRPWDNASYYINTQNAIYGRVTQHGSHTLNWNDRSKEMGIAFASCMLDAQHTNGIAYESAGLAGNAVWALRNDQEYFIELVTKYCTADASAPADAPANRSIGYNMLFLSAIARIQLASVGEGDRPALKDALIDMLADYYVSGNADGSQDFVVLAGMQVAGQRHHGKNSTPTLYSYPAAIQSLAAAHAIQYDVTLFNEMCRNTVWDYQLYTWPQEFAAGSDPAANAVQWESRTNPFTRNQLGGAILSSKMWMSLYYSNALTSPTGFNEYTNTSKEFWKSPYGWESCIFSVDKNNTQQSTPGIWMLSGKGTVTGDSSDNDHGHPVEVFPKSPEISLNVNPTLKKVENECDASNTVDIKVKLSANSDAITAIYAYYQQEAAKHPGLDMQIRLDFTAVTTKSNMGVAKEPADPSFFDMVVKGTGDYTPNGNNTVLLSNRFNDKGTLMDFLTGGKSTVELKDMNITVCDKVVNDYKVKAVICFNNSSVDDIRITPTGAEVEEPWAKDTATLYVNEEPHYYSEMRHVPFSEIKADAPGSERYEAMSGVPTTEDIYLGTGATEFVVNVDLKYRTETAKRIYTITVNNSNCYGNNTPCSGVTSCPTHPQDGDPPPPPAKCGVSHSCEYGSFYSGEGCAAPVTHRNHAHQGTCTYTYTITMPIEEYAYMDITDEDLYRLDYMQLKGNKLLQNPSDIKLDPNTGYYSFHDQESYSSGSGRLHYNVHIAQGSSSTAADGQLWGDTSFTKPIAINGLHSSCKTQATTAINAVVQTLTDVYVTSVSDYVVLETSEGYQHIASYVYDSNHISLASLTVSDGDWGECDDTASSHSDFSKDVTSDPITWKEVPEQEKMWDNNSDCAAKWDPTDVTTTGYNGDYEDVNGKYDNTNKTRSTNKMQKYIDDGQPNLASLNGNTNFYDGGDYNPRYVRTGVNILDSTTMKTINGNTIHGNSIPLSGYVNESNYISQRLWSASDSVKPVTNGEWDTKHCYSKYSKPITWKSSNGKKWDKWCKEVEAPYSEEHEKINNIVIHNPLSNVNATLISNDSKYDDRYWGDLDRMPAPTYTNKCPRDSSCSYSTRICSKSSLHTAACYKMVDLGYSCGSPFNTHVHVASCYVPTYEYEWVWSCRNHPGRDWGVNPPNWTPCSASSWTRTGNQRQNGQQQVCQPTVNKTYNYTGNEFTVQLPAGESELTLSGGAGYKPDHGNQGLGGVIRVKLKFPAATTIYVNVGGNGSSSAGGYNGGGEAKPSVDSGGGGGATSIALKSGLLRNLSPADVIAVAAGGGAGGCNGYTGGSGGYPNGTAGYGSYSYGPSGLGATQSGPGTSYSGYSAGFGYGARGGTIFGSGAGGAGYYGGGAGNNETGGGAAGGGGSSYVNPTYGSVVSTGTAGSGSLVIKAANPSYMNAHTHTSSCKRSQQKVTVCTDPHHHEPGEPHDVASPNNHYPFADMRCYKPCSNDDNHNAPKEVKLPDGSVQKQTNLPFINIDRDFQIYYPDTGDFEQLPGMQGISDCSPNRGKGYVNNTDTNVWVRNKFVMFPTTVIDSSGNYWMRGEAIDLNKLPIIYKTSDKKEWNDDSSKQTGRAIYTFMCTSVNVESANATVTYRSVGSNAPEIYTYSASHGPINTDRYTNLSAPMSVTKTQLIDVVGSIGSLTIHDSGDPRFAELFKQPEASGWLIPNVVRKVDYTLPNMVVTDDKDVRLEKTYDTKEQSTGKALTSKTNFHGTYGMTNQASGGKNHQYLTLPLTSTKNPIAALQKESMRPGYNLYMDIETLGSYYGENIDYTVEGPKTVFFERDADGTGAYTKFMQIKPTYYELNLETGKYKEVDVYMKSGSTYEPVYLTNKEMETVEYYNFLKWLEESQRRNFTDAESKNSITAQTHFSNDDYHMRLPLSDPDVIGTADKLYLIDLDRTFIGSQKRYGIDMDRANGDSGKTANSIPDGEWAVQSQRWHFTLGLPSSSVFVYAGTKPSNDTKFQEDIKTIQNHRAVIVCTLNIKVRGNVWTLEYDGTALNSEPLRIYDGDTPKEYPTPRDPKDPNKPSKDPVVVVYDNKRTSADDMQTQGSH